MARWLVPLAILAVPLFAQDDAADKAALEREKTWIGVARETAPKTVLVEVKTPGGMTAGAGSGAIVSADGLVLTCAHVVEALGVRRVASTSYSVVTSDGKRHEAKLLGRCSVNDFALLKFEARDRPHFEVSADLKPARGDAVMAVGFPMGNLGTGGVRKGKARDALVTASVMIGRVEEVERPFVIPAQGGQKYYPRAIASDAPVYMGNSGGPLVDERGRLLGLNAAIMPAANRTFTLSIRDVAKAFASLKEGRDAAGEGLENPLEDAGRTILEALGSNFGERGPDRPWLRGGFETMARARASGIVELYRGANPIGFAALIDEEGRAVTSIAALENRTWGDLLMREIDRQVEGNETLKDLWDRMKGLLDRGGESAEKLTAKLSTGERVGVEVVKDSKSVGVALIKLAVPSGRKLRAIPQAPYAALRAGQWGVSAGSEGRILGAGMVSTGHHSAEGVISLPTSLTDLWDTLTRRGENRQDTFRDAILHDAALGKGELGSPLLDSQGRLIGVNLYHPARGTTYAARLDNILREFGLGRGF